IGVGGPKHYHTRIAGNRKACNIGHITSKLLIYSADGMGIVKKWAIPSGPPSTFRMTGRLGARAIDSAHWPSNEGHPTAQAFATDPAPFIFDGDQELFRVHGAKLWLAINPANKPRDWESPFIDG